MVLHKKTPIPSGFNFSNFPETLIVGPAPVSLNINVSGYGLITGTTGLRWWDSSLVTSSGVVNLAANSTLVLPFTTSFLNPGYLVDLIAKVSLNGIHYYYAASNSPDNAVVSIPNADKKLFYINLVCCGYNNDLGSSSANNNFMQGGTGAQGEGNQPVTVFLSDVSIVAGSFSISATYVSYDNTSPAAGIFTKTVAYSANTSEKSICTIREMFLYFYNTFGYLTYQHQGYYKIQITCSDPAYTSMLNYYHYGQSN